MCTVQLILQKQNGPWTSSWPLLVASMAELFLPWSMNTNSREKEDESDATADDEWKMCGLSSLLRKRCDGHNVCEYEDGGISSSIVQRQVSSHAMKQKSTMLNDGDAAGMLF